MNWHRLRSAFLCLIAGGCGGGEDRAPAAVPAAVSTAEVTGLRLKIAGLQEGTCSGSDVSQPLTGGSGSGTGSRSVQSPSCIRSGADWIFEGANLSATSSVPDGNFSSESGGNDSWIQYAYWYGTILPGAPAGTTVSFDVSFDYSYSYGVTGVEARSNRPPAAIYQHAGARGNVFLIGVYETCQSGYCFDNFSEDILRRTLFDSSVSEYPGLSWSSVSGAPPPPPAAGSGHVSVSTSASLSRDVKYFILGAAVMTSADQH